MPPPLDDHAAPRALARLLRELTTSGAVTVRTPFAGRPQAIAAETSIHLGGAVIVRVDPALRAAAPEWAEHQRAIAAQLAPLATLQRWLRLLKVPDFVRRWLPLPALAGTFSAGTRLQIPAQRWAWALAWALASIGVALFLRYALRPLVVRAITRALRRELAAGAGSTPEAGGVEPPGFA